MLQNINMWRMVQKIHHTFGKNLLLANTLSSGGLLVVGDLIQQRREGHKFDVNRCLRMCTVGLSQGPPHHYFYILLDKYLPGRTGKVVFKKIMFDQIFAAPFFAITFIYGASLLEGRSLGYCWAEFKTKFPTIYLFDWLIWPPTQFINFSYVPPQYRVLYVNMVTVVWDVFLSYIKHRDEIVENIERKDKN
ncbi:mpv17-like protein 2 [Eurytemora carolleeae]|uniref:mpv17-like protein 2 n=1 Tax=Eurytemora carolleeae TaxID=1294199 RepID=UPI000C78BF5A|nr:mpv17-like protein 2 [Eurytemora carolleeae]|eukprot:XP_023325668.1 mpv17-like protein 2 [Eurytemora affinis]